MVRTAVLFHCITRVTIAAADGGKRNSWFNALKYEIKTCYIVAVNIITLSFIWTSMNGVPLFYFSALPPFGHFLTAQGSSLLHHFTAVRSSFS